MKFLAAMGALRLSYYLISKGKDGIFSAFPTLLDPTITKESLEQYVEAVIMEEEPPMKRLLSFCGHNIIARVCLELCALQYMEPAAELIFREVYQGEYGGVTVALAGRLIYPQDGFYDCFHEMQEAFDLVSLLLNAGEGSDFTVTPLALDARIADFAEGGKRVDARIDKIARVFTKEETLPSLLIREEQIGRVAKQLSAFEKEQEASCLVHIFGGYGIGKRFAAKHIARFCGLVLLLVDGAFLKGEPSWVLHKTRIIIREAMLCGGAICLYGWKDKDSASLLPSVKRFLWEAEKLQQPVFITSEDNIRILPFLQNKVLELSLPPCTPAESSLLWEGFTARYWGKHSLNCYELASKMRLSAGIIEKIVKIASFSLLPEERISQNIFRICYHVLDDGRYENVKRVESSYTWEDLKLESKQKNILKDVCNQIEYRLKVMVNWDMISKYAYGTCTSVLFSGPPGTGKTMAAHVLSSMLGLELYKVDLSQVVDKYIGETEKRLEEVFARAEKTNMILFFDEADAVLGKRSEVKDAKDKHANTEVSYLLQRMEEYDGMVILATNNAQNIDRAFIRRIRYVINFPIPDKDIRMDIWKSAISDKVPTEGIDFDFLASQFEFSGGNIKNCVLNAVFLAAAEDSPLSMKHLLRAVYLESTKDKQVTFGDIFGKYGHLVDL